MGRQILALVVGALAGVAVTAQPHHSWSTVYDGGRDVDDLTATISGDHTRRPHDAIAIAITNDLGEPEEWTLQWFGEGGGRGGRGTGRGRDESSAHYDFNIGDEVVIDGTTVGRLRRDGGAVVG
jgi:hypothetical protein